MMEGEGVMRSTPTYPATVLGDFGGGTMFAMVGILLALRHRDRTGLGQVIDANIVCKWGSRLCPDSA